MCCDFGCCLDDGRVRNTVIKWVVRYGRNMADDSPKLFFVRELAFDAEKLPEAFDTKEEALAFASQLNESQHG